MITLNNCCFTYKDKLLINNLSFNINKGDKIVLYGPSGSGKSTILNAVLGFEKPDSGYVSFNGTAYDAVTISHVRSMTSYLPQDISLPYNTVKEIIYSPFEFKANKINTPTEKEILQYFKRLSLNDNLLYKKTNEISGGEKQRVLLATTILLKKPLMLLDEPTSALDSNSISHAIELLQSLTDTTMIAVSHDEKFINSFNKKILIPKL